MIYQINCKYCGLSRRLTDTEVAKGVVPALCYICTSKITVRTIETIDGYAPRVNMDKEEVIIDTYVGSPPFESKEAPPEEKLIDTLDNKVQDEYEDYEYGSYGDLNDTDGD